MKSGKNILLAVTLAGAFLLLKYDTLAADTALTALHDCVTRVIPSLFPYMVLSSFILALDLMRPLYRFIPMSVFKLPSCTAPVLITGLLCGFPVGAAGCASLYQSGRITKDEASRLCAISGHTSPAFLIGTVGALWDSKEFGAVLYGAGLVFALFSGIVMRFGCTSGVSDQYYPQTAVPKAVPAFCKAVTDAASSCLAVTGFIVFFRVACAAVTTVLPAMSDAFTATFEFSRGVIRGAELGGICGAAMTGFAVGFAGLSVFMQTMKYLSADEIPFLRVLVTKVLEGFFTAAVAVIYYHFHPMHPTEDALSGGTVPTISALLLPIFVLFTLHCAGYFLLRGNKCVRRS